MLNQQTFGPLVRLGDDATRLVVHRVGQSFTVRPASDFSRIAFRKRDGSQIVAHAVRAYLGVGDFRHLVQIVLRAGRHTVEGDRLGHAAAKRHAHPLEELLGRVEPLVGRRVLGESERLAGARHDRHFQQSVGVRQEPSDQRVAALVVGHDLALFGRDDLRPLLQSTHHSFNGVLQVERRHLFAEVAGGPQRRLVANVGDVGAAESGCKRCHPLGVG